MAPGDDDTSPETQREGRIAVDGAGGYQEVLTLDPAASAASGCTAYTYGPNRLVGTFAFGGHTFAGTAPTTQGTLYRCDGGEGGWYETITPVTVSGHLTVRHGSTTVTTGISAACSVTSYFVAVDGDRSVPLGCSGSISGSPTQSFTVVLRYPCATCPLYDTVGAPPTSTESVGTGGYTLQP